MTYKYCKTIITNKTYGTKESFQDKLDVFLLANRLTEAQYTELIALLEAA